eukprot:m.450277 g.450277  ORF g.450277 m.450277 type:complete len:289 (+) comp19957_c0_seq1:202-1068(+)
MGAGCSSTKSSNVVSPEPTKRPLEKQSEKTAEPEKATASGVASESQNAALDAATFEKFWPRKIMILFGKPGSGKGTAGPQVEALLKIPQLSTGDMLRAAVTAGTDVGIRAKAVMDKGELVTDEIVFGIVEERIQASDCTNGFILDGMPRTLAQAQMLDALLARRGERVSNVLCLDVPDSVLEDRITGRWIHKPSGRSYHISTKRPKSLPEGASAQGGADGNMFDDETGEELIQRGDDTAEALEKRLEAFREQTNPVLEHYKPTGVVKIVDANQEIGKVLDAVVGALAK